MGDEVVLVLVALISGGIGLAGSVINARHAAAARHEDRVSDRDNRIYEAKRDAYLQLLAAISRLESRAGGNLISGKGPITVGDSVVSEILDAEMAARLYAPPDIWARIDPAVRAVSLRANSLVGGIPGINAIDELQAMGAHTAEAAHVLYDEALQAMREDLAH